ncbi:glycosyltransferase family 4 protein [Jatrophihabitans sp. YIM 134969]
MEPVKVGLLLATSTGGVGAHVRSLAAGLVARGHEVTVAGPPSTEELFAFTATGAGFSPTRGRLDLRTVRSLDVEVLHAHGLRAGVLGGSAAGRTPLVVTWHNAVLDEEHGRLARAVLALGERFVARRATVTLAASDDLADRARSLGARDVRVAPVALDPPATRHDRDQVRAALGVAPSDRLVLTVARLHPQKALDVLIDAATGWPDAVVAVAGDGPLHDDLAARISSSHAPVRLLGRRDDVPDLLAAADLAVLPSRWEARSLFAQEALRAGVPLVTTAVGGLPGLVGDAAVTVPPGDVVALRTAVADLLADDTARAALGARGRARAATWPTERDTVEQVVGVYSSLV